jgi:predicted site-specific integrase-resolvase
MLKALNKASNINQASFLLGIERSTVREWIKKFDIKFNTQTNKYYGEVIQGARVTEKVR